MAPPKDSVIEQTLHRVVREAVRKDEPVTLKQARARAEKELGLEQGFFLDAEGWKSRSKRIIEAAFEADSEPEAKPAPAVPLLSKTQASQPCTTKDQGKAKLQNGKKGVLQAKTAPAKGIKSTISDERVREDDSSGDEGKASEKDNLKDSASNKPDQPKQVNGVKRKAEEQDSSGEDSESEDGSSSEDGDEAQAPQKKKARKDASSSGSGEESDDSSEEESDNEKESKNGSQAPKDTADSPSKFIAAIAAKSFVPPPGFTLVDCGILTSNLHQSSLEDKQIWHIAAPSSLTLSSIQEISLDALRSGQPVLTHNGVEYALSEDTESTRASILLAMDSGYQLLDQPIERSLQLQQKISLPSLSIRQADQHAGSSAAAEVTAPPISSIRPQPEGLRMRYRPPGSGTRRPGTSSSDLDAEEDAMDVDANTGLTQDFSTVQVDTGGSEGTTKKLKKKRNSKEADESTRPVVSSIPKVSAHAAHNTGLDQPKTPNGTPDESLSKEERKRLRRDRRESKQKAKS